MPVIFRAWVGGECSAQITPVRLVRECLDRIDYGCLFSLLLLSYIMLFSIALDMVLKVSRAAPHVQCAIRYFLSLFLVVVGGGGGIYVAYAYNHCYVDFGGCTTRVHKLIWDWAKFNV